MTVVLVTHSMEEAERAVRPASPSWTRGAWWRPDTPDALVALVQAGQVIRFRPDRPLELALLTALPQVTDVHARATRSSWPAPPTPCAVVTAVLARRDVFPERLRVEQATLDDAFVALTGRSLQPDPEEVLA